MLPTLKLFKISVKLDTTNKAEKKNMLQERNLKDMTLNDYHYNIIKETQNDIEITEEPLKKLLIN